MDPAHRGWPPQGSAEQGQSQQQQQRPGFGAGQHSPPQGASQLPPPPPGAGGPFPNFHQQAPSLASLAGLSQSSPRQPPPSVQRPDGPPQLPLPGFSQATGQLGATERADRAERERERARDVDIHIKEEEDRRQREQQERQRLEQVPPHHGQPPPMPLHQPVAVGPRSVHGPNGLLGNPGPQPQPQIPLGGPSGPANIFGGPVQPPAQSAHQQLQPGILVPFAPGGQQTQPAPAPAQQQQQQQGQAQGQGQGQQPILNDALTYLDQVKVQFADHPDVYNRFLDIMKDFKSGAIDTPGVIGRVSTLFAGNPELIQGFNTFLPPGYRIECIAGGADGSGAGSETIRVTTPMGTTVSAMPQPRPVSRQGDVGRLSPIPMPGQSGSSQMMFSPSGRPVGPATVTGQQQQQQPQQHLSPMQQREQEQQVQALGLHQQQERGVNSLQNAVSAATGASGIRAGVSPRSTPLPGQQQASILSDAQPGVDVGAGMEKRGPVEFNHAISYVNKIKNRFASSPDIYKQFLEILQTYQRESKPIQDVYGQVTHLFKTAPDLLEDFKQFLPESAAQAKAAERARQQAEESALLSNVRGEGGGMYGSPVISRETNIGTPTHGRGNLPPVGNFAPTPIGKDNKRKRGERAGTMNSATDGPAKGGQAYGAQQGGKRMKQTHTATAPKDQQPPASPTLIPRLPEPLPPTTTSAATHEEMSFFDRAKKAVGNKNTFNEFLKLCNLFSQDFIDRTTLIYRARSFLGGNQELMRWFETFIGYEEKDITIENRAREPMVPGGRISLSNCRGLGPSYRLLPKRERGKVCSGRDELCNSVLNDEWASHPTWASEDSGFIAHRKNVHEEGLHRIEEERHDYDYNIEACSRTIQLLEPIAQQLRRLSNEEQVGYRLPPGLGGQSETIYKRVIMKLYGREKGHEVIHQLHTAPYQVIPVLLNRLKERLETWKMAQREWEKVWREQTQKMFWRSLDHQGLGTGGTGVRGGGASSDGKKFQLKALLMELQTRFEEQKRIEFKEMGSMRGQPQLEVNVDDQEVVVDAAWLLLLLVSGQAQAENPRLKPFVEEFVPLFFGIDSQTFAEKLKERGPTVSAERVDGDEPGSGAEDSGSEKRGRKMGKANLLRQTLDKGRGSKGGRKDRDDSTPASRASTPDVVSNTGDDAAATDSMAVDTISNPTPTTALEDVAATAPSESQRWFHHPISDNVSAKKMDPNETQKRSVYRMWTNTPIYCFIRVFLMLYERLHRLKLNEEQCAVLVRNAKKPKPAIELGIMDKLPSDFFADTGASANYYGQMLQKFAHVLEGEIDFVNDGVEECLRRFYLQAGYPLYGFEKMVQILGRYAAQAVTLEGGNKDKSWDVFNLWKKDRVKSEISPVQATDYRKGVERMVGGAEQFAVDWDEEKKAVRVFLVKKDDPNYSLDGLSELDKENRWRYYIASYSSVFDTDGVDKKHLSPVILFRNLHAAGADAPSDQFPPRPLPATDPTTEGQGIPPTHEGAVDSNLSAIPNRLLNRFIGANNDERLIMRIAVNNYHPIFQPNTAEGFFEDMKEREGGRDGVGGAEESEGFRQEAVKDGFEMMNDGMKGLSKEEVEGRNERFGREMVEGEVVSAGEVEEGERMDVDG